MKSLVYFFGLVSENFKSGVSDDNWLYISMRSFQTFTKGTQLNYWLTNQQNNLIENSSLLFFISIREVVSKPDPFRPF